MCRLFPHSRKPQPPAEPDYSYISPKYQTSIEGTVVDTLQFDMGIWSDNTPVKQIDESWPQKCESLEAVAASFRLREEAQ